MVAAAEARPSSPARASRPVGRARLGQDAAQGPLAAHGDTARASAVAAGATTASKWGRRTGSWAATTTVRPSSHGSMAGAEPATVGGSSEAVGSSSRRIGRGAQQRAGQGDALALARAQGETVVAERRLQPAGRLAMSSDRPTAPSTRAARRRWRSGAPSRRFSASVALKRWGRCGSHEKWARHSADVARRRRHRRRRDMRARRRARRSASSAASTVDLPDPDGPVSATRHPGRRWSENEVQRGTVAVGVVDAAGRRRTRVPVRGAGPRRHGGAGSPAARAARGHGGTPAPRARAPPPPAPRCWRGTRRRPGAAG